MAGSPSISGVGPERAQLLRAQAEALAPGAAGSSKEQQALREAAEQFEAMFLESMLKAMRETIPEGGVLEGKHEDMYREMLDRELAQRMAQRDGYGLAEALVRQLTPEGSAGGAPEVAEGPESRGLEAYRAVAGSVRSEP